MELLSTDARAAVGLILSKYGAALQGVIFEVVRSQEVTEEVLQDVCIKIWKKAADYDTEKGRLFTWLLTIARNTAIDKTRSKEFRQSKRSDHFSASLHNDITLSESSKHKDVGLYRVVEGLEEKYSQLVHLLYLKGYTQKEAADELKIPLGTVKSRIRIALRELRKILSVATILLITKIIIEIVSRQ